MLLAQLVCLMVPTARCNAEGTAQECSAYIYISSCDSVALSDLLSVCGHVADAAQTHCMSCCWFACLPSNLSIPPLLYVCLVGGSWPAASDFTPCPHVKLLVQLCSLVAYFTLILHLCNDVGHGTNVDGLWLRPKAPRGLQLGSIIKFGASSRTYTVSLSISSLARREIINATKHNGSGKLRCFTCCIWHVHANLAH